MHTILLRIANMSLTSKAARRSKCEERKEGSQMSSQSKTAILLELCVLAVLLLMFGSREPCDGSIFALDW
jgi:hypothetical protein